MKKPEMVAAVAERSNLSSKDATKAIDAVFETIRDTLKAGDEVRIGNFGVFVAVDRPESMGRDPRSGEPIKIKAARVPKFRAGKPLRDALNS